MLNLRLQLQLVRSIYHYYSFLSLFIITYFISSHLNKESLKLYNHDYLFINYVKQGKLGGMGGGVVVGRIN